MKSFPTGWVRAPLKSLLSSDGLFSDGDWIESKDQDPNGTIRLLQLADIGDGYFINKSSRFVNKEKFVALNCTELHAGDVLIARMPDPLGRACLLPEISHSCITVVDVAVFRTGKEGVSNKWLVNTINSPQLRAFMETNSSGTTRKRIAKGKLADMELPVPPLSEQKRIADKLDALQTRVDECRDHFGRIPLILKRFRQSVLAAAFSGRLTENWRNKSGIVSTWEIRKLGNLATKVGSGSTPRGGETVYKLEGIPLIRSMNVIFFGFKRNGLAFLDEAQAHELRNVEVHNNDILLNITGASIGRVTLAPADMAGARVNQHVCIIRPTQEIIPSYLCSLLSSPEMQALFGSENYGVTRQALTKQQILDFDIPVPTQEEQNEIVRRVEALFAHADRLETRYANACAQIEKLRPASLAKAFRGELVPQDLGDEPAGELLARITKHNSVKTKIKSTKKSF